MAAEETGQLCLHQLLAEYMDVLSNLADGLSRAPVWSSPEEPEEGEESGSSPRDITTAHLRSTHAIDKAEDRSVGLGLDLTRRRRGERAHRRDETGRRTNTARNPNRSVGLPSRSWFESSTQRLVVGTSTLSWSGSRTPRLACGINTPSWRGRTRKAGPTCSARRQERCSTSQPSG